MIRKTPLLAAVLGMTLATAATAAVDIKTGESSAGPVLTDAAGMTLYTFDKDKDGMSACYDDCAGNWPPAMAPDGATAEGDYGVTERKDNTYQWTYKGMPLYTFAKDAKAGDVTGDGVKGVWHIAKP